MKIDIILTDNGFEFTNKYIKPKKGECCKKEAKFRTPYEALEMFYPTRPDLFKENPVLFKEKLLLLCNKITE